MDKPIASFSHIGYPQVMPTSINSSQISFCPIPFDSPPALQIKNAASVA